jgi:energy-coupling factor transport system ATP-binding protein
MDRRHRERLAGWLGDIGSALLVATHDPEFVAAFADRVLLLADGTVIADGSPGEVLSGARYFATEVARILAGAGGALTAEQGIAMLTRTAAEEVPA